MAGETLNSSARREPPPDRALAELANRQHGVVCRGQLLELGLDRNAIAYRKRVGRLHRIHWSVYAVGHSVLTREGRYLAAVFAYGRDARLSHRSAAALHEFVAGAGRIEVTTPNRSCTPRSGLLPHSCRSLDPWDTTTVDRIPVTTPARTFLDLADVWPVHRVERALNQAEVMNVFDLVAIEDTLSRANGRRGIPILKDALARLAEAPALTREEMELLFLALCDRIGLPRPLVNHELDLGHRIVIPDFLWPQHDLIVETDSWRFHRTRRAFENDRSKIVDLQLAGYVVLPFTWRVITNDPRRVEHALLRATSRSRPRPRGASDHRTSAPRCS